MLFFTVEAVPDYSKLTLTQAKRLEMESQVRKFHFNLFTLNSGQLENYRGGSREGGLGS